MSSPKILFCQNCNCDVVALPSGECPWCTPELPPLAEPPRHPDGECRHCGKPFWVTASYSRARIYCDHACQQAAYYLRSRYSTAA